MDAPPTDRQPTDPIPWPPASVEAADAPVVGRDAANWAKPVDRLSAAGVTGASDDAVSGRRVTGPLVGFGQLWQKTFTVRLEGVDITPEGLVAHWKQAFPTFWPKGNRFWVPMSGIAPGEVGCSSSLPCQVRRCGCRAACWSSTPTPRRSRS